MQILLRNLQKKIPIPSGRILKALGESAIFFKKMGGCPQNLSIVFAGPKRMRALNKKYLGHDYATDVLTFDLGNSQAEIIICPAVASAQAKAHQTSTEKELILYAIHGILHLAGFDDRTPKDRVKMRKMEKKLTTS
jgi:probable rRNA maturation factor